MPRRLPAITWTTGWTTKITKQGNQYHKAAYRKGQSLDAAPANSSDAQKSNDGTGLPTLSQPPVRRRRIANTFDGPAQPSRPLAM